MSCNLVGLICRMLIIFELISQCVSLFYATLFIEKYISMEEDNVDRSLLELSDWEDGSLYELVLLLTSGID
jgi:hypothetical protein